MRKMAETSPTPNQRMAIGIQASGEIGRRSCRIGFTASSPRRQSPEEHAGGDGDRAARRGNPR